MNRTEKINNMITEMRLFFLYNDGQRFYLDEYEGQEEIRKAWFHNYEHRHFWDDLEVTGKNPSFINNSFNKVV